MPSWQLESWVESDFKQRNRGCGGFVAIVHGPLDRGLVKGHQGKFNGHEEAGTKDQQQTCCKKDPFHLLLPRFKAQAQQLRWGGGCPPAEGGRRWGRPACPDA